MHVLSSFVFQLNLVPEPIRSNNEYQLQYNTLALNARNSVECVYVTSVKLLILWSIVNYVSNLLPLVFSVNCCIALLLFFTVELSLL